MSVYTRDPYPTGLRPNFPFIRERLKARGGEGCRLYVELGVWQGGSLRFVADCTDALDYRTRCVGVDTFQGDRFTGPPMITPKRARAVILDGAPANVEILQMTFDDALDQFGDGTVDVLLIDGDHSYEAVKHDFVTWLPKVAGGGEVWLHDIDRSVGSPPYEVGRFWAELTAQYRTLADHSGMGLGVILS